MNVTDDYLSHATVDIDELLDSLGWAGQIGQMAQIDINMLLTDDHTALRQDLLDHYIGTLGVGSVLNNQNRNDPLWTIADFRAAAIQIQETAQKFGNPPVLWGLDSVHGASYLYDAIITPQPLNLAASFNITLSFQAGQIASRDTRRAGISWLFSPLLGLSWNPFWPRVYETFGEDPELVGSMALAMTRGIQAVDDTIVPSRAAACGKHFIGYSAPRDGHDRSPSWIPTRHLYQYFVLPWKKVVLEIDTIMESFSEVDGVPIIASRKMLNTLLRRELGFEGMLVTDYHEVFNLYEWHQTAQNRTDAMLQALTEGTFDMSMIANEPDDFFAAFDTVNLKESQWENRVRSSALRVLKLKQKLNMFEESFGIQMDDAGGPGHTAADLKLALDMTEQTIILAKNDNDTLPLPLDSSLRVLVTGPTANVMSYATGGWTWQWQGVNSTIEDEWFTYGSTVLHALTQEQNFEVSYSCGVDILGHTCDTESEFDNPRNEGGNGTVPESNGWNSDQSSSSIERVMALASTQDVIVVCLGEENYTEKPGGIRSLSLPSG